MSQKKPLKSNGEKKQSRLKRTLKLIFSIVGVASIVIIVQFVIQEKRDRELHQFELERAKEEQRAAAEEAMQIQEERE